jgi:hypothetical protein
MSDADRNLRQPHQGERATADKAAREARLAAAMRDNLRKRKQQQQERQSGAGGAPLSPRKGKSGST